MRTAGAKKIGRNPRYPFVPVIVITQGARVITTQIRGFAFTTRSEALFFAQKTIEYNDERCKKETV